MAVTTLNEKTAQAFAVAMTASRPMKPEAIDAILATNPRYAPKPNGDTWPEPQTFIAHDAKLNAPFREQSSASPFLPPQAARSAKLVF